LVSNLDLDSVLHQILAQMGQVLRFDAALVVMVEEEAMTVHAYHAPTSEWTLVDSDVPVDRDAFVPTALSEGNPNEVSLINADERIEEFVRRYLGTQFGDGSLLYAPLKVKGATIGILFLVCQQPNAFPAGTHVVLQQYTNFVAIALENARLYRQASEQATERERVRLAQDLHNSLTQTIFSASLIADVLPDTWRQNPLQAEESLRDLRGLTRAALAESRSLLIELRPSSIHQIPLGQLLAQLTEAIAGRTNLPCHLFIENIPVLSEEVQYVFYRIAQEGLNNVVKHARASEVRVSLGALPPVSRDSLETWYGIIQMTIADNGRGFDVSNFPGGWMGFGLKLMQERAETVGANLAIDSEPGQGTKLTLTWGKSN
jgi:signal transduction histidine kinase